MTQTGSNETTPRTDEMGRPYKICQKCGADAETLYPVDKDDFHAMGWVAGKGYARLRPTVRRVCRECIRG